MALEIEGKIITKLPVQNGTSARGPWSKQEFVIEYQEGNYPNQVCMNVWGEDKVKDLEQFQAGETVKVSFNLSSREYNGRWYSDIRAWRIERAGSASQSQSQSQAQAPGTPGFTAPTGAGAPQQPAAPAATATDFDSGSGDSEDDLPF